MQASVVNATWLSALSSLHCLVCPSQNCFVWVAVFDQTIFATASTTQCVVGFYVYLCGWLLGAASNGLRFKMRIRFVVPGALCCRVLFDGL